MKEIIIKKGDVDVVKLPFDQGILEDYEEYKDQADEKCIKFLVIGSERSHPQGSIVIKILSTGKMFKEDFFTHEPVLYMKSQVVETSNENYKTGSIIWIEFLKADLDVWGLESVEKVRDKLYGEKILVSNVGKPKKKADEDVTFVYRYGSLRLL